MVIVHAADQPFNEAPSKAPLELIPMLRDLRDDTSAILPAALHTVEASQHYAFTVECTSSSDGSKLFLPCQRVLALVRSSKNSKATNLGDGFKLITPDVEDLLGILDPTGAASETRHTLSAICKLSNLTQYKVDPPRGGKQDALVLITAKSNDSFVTESVQLLTPEEAADVKQSLLKMQQLAMHIHVRDRKRARQWTDELSPIIGRKCSRIGRSPTDLPLPN